MAYNYSLKERITNAYQALRGRDSNAADRNTSVDGYLTSEPAEDRYSRRWAEPLERDLLVNELEELYADHPVLDAALRKFAEGAVGSGFNVTVVNADTDPVAAKAQRIIDRTKANCELEKYLPSLAHTTIGFGNLFAQVVVDEHGEIVDALEMPNRGMVRNTNTRDEFIQGQPAFIQRVNGNSKNIPFGRGQIIQVRFNHKRGQRYGLPMIFAGRAVAKDSLAALRSLLPRRLANQPFRRFNVSPNKGIVFSLFQKIKENLSRLVYIQKGGQVSPWDDVFVNNVDVDVLGGKDSDGGDLKDIEMLLDALLICTGLSRQLLGWASTSVQRDIADEQREESYKQQRSLVRLLIEQFLQPLFDLALALQGIPPATVEYKIEFADQFTDSRMERRIEQSRNDFEAGIVSIESCLIMRQGYYPHIKDPAEEIARIQKERAAGLLPLKAGKAEQQATLAPNAPQPAPIGGEAPAPAPKQLTPGTPEENQLVN